MAMPNVRAFAIYFDNGRKAFTVNQQTLTIPAGRQAVFGAEGYLAHSKGAVQVRLNLTEITPVGGSDLADLREKHIKQQNVIIGLDMAGKTVQAEFAITTLEFSSNTETGVPTGTGTFEGGIPQLI